MITAAQIRAARTLLGWKQTDLAAASGVPEIAIKTIERDQTDRDSSTVERVQKALEEGGVLFLAAGDQDDGGPGLRWKNRE